MTVLVPLPANGGEVFGFLIELSHIINTAKDNVVVRIDENNVHVKACYVQTSDDCEGMDFVLRGSVDDNEIEWVERFSSITISSVGDEIVLQPGLFRPILVLHAA